jgi:hypothetical protein
MSIHDQSARGKGTFRMVPDKLWMDGRVEGSDLKVWCALCWLARSRPHVDATDDAIAGAAKIGARTVRRSLSRLEDLGFLERTDGDRGRRIVLRPEGRGAGRPSFGVIG